MKKMRAINSMTQGKAYDKTATSFCLFNPVYLEGLHESPKKGSDVFILVQELDQSRHTEETEEGDGHHLPIKQI